MNRPVKRLACKRFLMNLPIVSAIKETSNLDLQFVNRLRGITHQSPGQILIIYESAALEGVFKMFFQGVFFIQDHIKPTLNHPAAPTLPYQSFGCHDDLEAGIAVVCMQGGKQTCAATAKDQYVGLYDFHNAFTP